MFPVFIRDVPAIRYQTDRETWVHIWLRYYKYHLSFPFGFGDKIWQTKEMKAMFEFLLYF